MSVLDPERVSVRVPATSANLGPAFDCAGLALTHHDVLDFAVVPDGLTVDADGGLLVTPDGTPHVTPVGGVVAAVTPAVTPAVDTGLRNTPEPTVRTVAISRMGDPAIRRRSMARSVSGGTT